MDKRGYFSAALWASMLLSLPVVFALETDLEDFLGQLNAIIGAFIVLSILMIFITAFLVKKLEMDDSWRNMLISLNLIIIALWMVSAYVEIPIPAFGTMLMVLTGIYGGFLAIGFAEYLGEKKIWSNPQRAEEAELEALKRKLQRMGATAAAQEIGEEEKLKREILAELRALVKEYKKVMQSGLTYGSRDDAISMAKEVIKVQEYQDESLLLFAAIIQTAEIAGKESREDRELTQVLNNSLVHLCKRKRFLDEKSVEKITVVLKKDQTELEAERVGMSKGFEEGKKERREISALYDLHKKALSTLQRVRNELLTDEKLDAQEKNLDAWIEQAEARSKGKEVKGERKEEEADARTLMQEMQLGEKEGNKG